MRLSLIAGIALVVAGGLEALFLALSIVGTLFGAIGSAMAVADQFRNEELWVGPLLLGAYGLWLFCTVFAAPLHLVAGVRMIMGHVDPRLRWAAVVVSFLPLLTVYCAPTSLVAAALGLAAILAERRPTPAA